MQPEALCGPDVEEVQKRTAETVKSLAEPHDLLRELLKIPFDAILTTNYTYEIEMLLSWKTWTEYARRKAYIALDGNTKVGSNTFVCNAVHTTDGRIVPVFHIHGELGRKSSIILGYYSYANALSRLVEYNKKRKNYIEEHQKAGKSLRCKCWLDYFVAGDVWSVGFGLDLSEFDIWWAIERKAREKAKHGSLSAYFAEGETSDHPQKIMLKSLNADPIFISANKNYESHYQRVIEDIRKKAL